MEGVRDRFKDAPWFDIANNVNIALGGLGGIGSWTAFLLGRLGVSVTAFDFDNVEAHNIGGQLFPVSAVNRLKGVAYFTEVHQMFNGVDRTLKFNPVPRRMTGGDAELVTITAFDNMTSRRNLFVGWTKLVNRIRMMRDSDGSPMPFAMFIDGRMTAEFGQVLTVPYNVPDKEYKRRRRLYLDSLFSDDKQVSEPCAFRATSHNAALMASLITSVLVNGFMNYKLGEDIREVPAKMEYGLPFIYLNKIMP